LYTFKWIAPTDQNKIIVNIHAGFDETSGLIRQKFIGSELTVLDFYDPLKHTEISIKRARKVYPACPGTIPVSSTNLPLKDNSADIIFAILSAHEIRNDKERIRFFTELKRIIRPDGQIYVTEHLRDRVNFLAYNIGFLHFHSHRTWLDTFSGAGLQVNNEIKITPFISTFILKKNGTSS
jgi:SAM-dependent methyltransferase